MFAPRTVALYALFCLTASAFGEVEWNKRVPLNALDKRQSSGQYQAPEEQKPGSNCTEAFGDGYLTCRPKSATEIRLCYNPSIGQVCCQNEWGCPSGSYCLTENYCCPSGIEAATCAATYSVTLPASFTTGGSGPASTSTSTTTSFTTYLSTIVSSTAVATVPLSSGSVVAAANATTLTSSLSVTPVPYPAGNTTARYIASTAVSIGVLGTGASYPSGPGFGGVATSSGVGAASTSSIQAFQGGASGSREVGVLGAGLAALLAVAGLL